MPLRAGDGERPTIIVSYTADEPSRSLRSSVDAALVKTRHSVTQLMVTVLAHIDDDIRSGAPRRASPHP